MMPLPAVIHWTSPAAERAVVAQAVAMLHGAGEHVGDRLDAAVRMPRESGEVIRRAVVAEIVEQQKRIELRRVAEAERAAQLDAGAFDGGLRLHDAFYGTDGHDVGCLSLGSGGRGR